MGSGNNLNRKMKPKNQWSPPCRRKGMMNRTDSPAYAPSAKIFEAFVGEGVVVILPGETGLDKALRCERLHGFNDF